MRRWRAVTTGLMMMALGGIHAEAAAPAAGGPEAGTVLARVNQVEITYEAFKTRLDQLQQDRGPIPPERQAEILRAMVREEILAQEASADHLDQDAAVHAKLEQARRQVLIEELLKRRVAAQGQVGDDDIRKTYADNAPLFTTETVSASHIMVKTEAEAETILQELKAGKDFAELAKAKSQDTGSAEKGGDLGTLSRGQTVPEFEEAAFGLKEGELSGVVKTKYGYHIIKGGPRASVTQPFEQVKDRIRQMLGQQKQREILVGYITELEKRAKTEIYEDRLR